MCTHVSSLASLGQADPHTLQAVLPEVLSEDKPLREGLVCDTRCAQALSIGPLAHKFETGF